MVHAFPSSQLSAHWPSPAVTEGSHVSPVSSLPLPHVAAGGSIVLESVLAQAEANMSPSRGNTSE